MSRSAGTQDFLSKWGIDCFTARTRINLALGILVCYNSSVMTLEIRVL